MATEESTKTYEIHASESKQDEEGLITIWDLAAVDPEGGERTVAETRMVASKILSFLCKNKYDYVLIAKHDIGRLDELCEQDDRAFFKWTPESEQVDNLTQCAKVPAGAGVSFLKQNGFDANEKYSPRKADKLKWFQQYWNVEAS